MTTKLSEVSSKRDTSDGDEFKVTNVICEQHFRDYPKPYEVTCGQYDVSKEAVTSNGNDIYGQSSTPVVQSGLSKREFCTR